MNYYSAFVHSELGYLKLIRNFIFQQISSEYQKTSNYPYKDKWFDNANTLDA